jgi:threonine/homoserine/homoserine lactone efflux protein
VTRRCRRSGERETDGADSRAKGPRPVRPLRAIRYGFVVGAANPKSIVFFVVGLPEFTTTAPGHLAVPMQMIILGSLFPAIALVLDSGWAAVAGTVRQWLVGSPRRLALIGGTGGPGNDRARRQPRRDRPQGLSGRELSRALSRRG